MYVLAVSQVVSVREEQEGKKRKDEKEQEGREAEEEGGGGRLLAVRPRLCLVCPSSGVPCRHVPPPPAAAPAAATCYWSREGGCFAEFKPPETPSSPPAFLPACLSLSSDLL